MRHGCGRVVSALTLDYNIDNIAIKALSVLALSFISFSKVIRSSTLESTLEESADLYFLYYFLRLVIAFFTFSRLKVARLLVSIIRLILAPMLLRF